MGASGAQKQKGATTSYQEPNFVIIAAEVIALRFASLLVVPLPGLALPPPPGPGAPNDADNSSLRKRNAPAPLLQCPIDARYPKLHTRHPKPVSYTHLTLPTILLV